MFMENLKEESEAITSSILDTDNIENAENVQEMPMMIRWKSGKKVDPRLIMLLDFFRDLYLKRGEFFKKIFPLDHEDFIPVFEKIGAVFSKKDHIIGLERSPSDSSLHRSRGIDESQLKLERFKVKTPEVQSGGGGGGSGGGGSGGQGQGQGSTKASGSK